MTTLAEVEIVDLDADAAFARFDAVCQRYLSMSGEDFVDHYRHGKFDGIEPDSIPGLPKVLSMLPFAGISD